MNMFTVIAEPNRRQLLDELRDGARTVNMLVDVLDLSQPAVSKHLRVLREAGLVKVRPDGQQRWYQVDATPLAELDAWLEPYRAAWFNRLDQLEQHLARVDERGAPASRPGKD